MQDQQDVYFLPKLDIVDMGNFYDVCQIKEVYCTEPPKGQGQQTQH